jgi:putative transposase
MSRTISPSCNQPYGVARVVAVWGLARSSFYAARHRQQHPRKPQKRGPKVLSDEELLVEIRQLLAAPVFAGEGYRKIWARLRHKGVRTSKDRVLRLLRENHLLSPARQPELVCSHPHEGTIVTEAPNEMWGTDATATFTDVEGTVTVFAALDHYTAECVGIHVIKKADRFEALEPIRQGVKEYFPGYAAGSAEGLRLRHDHGSVYMSDDFQTEIRFLGIEPSPAFVRQPEGNGCIERFFRTLKEQLLWVRRFHDLDELRAALREFQQRYNEHWIIGVSSQGHIVQSVRDRPRLKDSGLVAGEAPWRESKTAEPSDNMLRKECAQRTRLQRAVNADVASLHESPVAETVDNARKQQGLAETSPMRQLSPAGYQRRHGVKDDVETGETLGARRRNLAEEMAAITVSGKCGHRRQGGGSGRTTVDGRAAKRARREGPGPASIPSVKARQG